MSILLFESEGSKRCEKNRNNKMKIKGVKKMNILRCKNGSFKIENVREYINFQNGTPKRYIDIQSTNSITSFDEVADVLTKDTVKEFEILSESGVILDTIKNVKLTNINKDISNSVSIVINFEKE